MEWMHREEMSISCFLIFNQTTTMDDKVSDNYRISCFLIFNQTTTDWLRRNSVVVWLFKAENLMSKNFLLFLSFRRRRNHIKLLQIMWFLPMVEMTKLKLYFFKFTWRQNFKINPFYKSSKLTMIHFSCWFIFPQFKNTIWFIIIIFYIICFSCFFMKP